MSVTIQDNSQQVLNTKNQAVKKALEMIGLQ